MYSGRSWRGGDPPRVAIAIRNVDGVWRGPTQRLPSDLTTLARQNTKWRRCSTYKVIRPCFTCYCTISAPDFSCLAIRIVLCVDLSLIGSRVCHQLPIRPGTLCDDLVLRRIFVLDTTIGICEVEKWTPAVPSSWTASMSSTCCMHGSKARHGS